MKGGLIVNFSCREGVYVWEIAKAKTADFHKSAKQTMGRN